MSKTGNALILPCNNETCKTVSDLRPVELEGNHCTFQNGGTNCKLFQTIEIMTTGSEHTLKPYMVLHFRNKLGWKMKPVSLLAAEFS